MLGSGLRSGTASRRLFRPEVISAISSAFTISISVSVASRFRVDSASIPVAVAWSFSTASAERAERIAIAEVAVAASITDRAAPSVDLDEWIPERRPSSHAASTSASSATTA
jgi:hypothetical protein